MTTANLHVHQWLFTAHPHLVDEYIQYKNSNPFQFLQLAYAVKDLESIESMYRELIDIVRYWLRYQVDTRFITLSFGLVADVAVNLIIVFSNPSAVGRQYRFWEKHICGSKT